MPTVEKSVSLKSYNTFAVDVSAQYFAQVCTPEDIRSVLADPRYGQLPRFVLGGGSNTLFTKDFEGLVLHMNGGTIEVTDENDRFYFVKVSAGIVWDDFVRHAIESGWYGIENLAAIPGTVGGAAVQNIGAYGVEVAEHIVEVECFDPDRRAMRVLSAEDCDYGYRASRFKTTEKNPFFLRSQRRLTPFTGTRSSKPFSAIAVPNPPRNLKRPCVRCVHASYPIPRSFPMPAVSLKTRWLRAPRCCICSKRRRLL